jgi:hypothetical protein
MKYQVTLVRTQYAEAWVEVEANDATGAVIKAYEVDANGETDWKTYSTEVEILEVKV